ncbi:MAG: salicylate hydroxylase [Candidatus Tokpelaia sp. JSC189]|nr:MAG: salicylate hydroxylase [Candidatus Tokpelaia sp. JSC189]
MPIQERICVSGAGIAGMSVAIALAAKGINVTLFEKSSSLREVGVGLQLTPNVTSILREWGLLDNLYKHAVEFDRLDLKNGIDGKTLVHIDVQTISQKHWKAPYISIHRADLQTVLKAEIDKNPLIEFKADHEVISYEGSWDLGFATKILHNRTTKIILGQILIGCDGVWSPMRASFSERANFSGYIAWRTTMAAEKLSADFTQLNGPRIITIWMGKNGHFISYPLKNGGLFNFVAITRDKNLGSACSENGDRSKLLGFYKDWHSAITNVIRQAPQWTFWPLFKMPFPRFLGPSGEIFLGDASHAITPFAAQGAAMAIEDAAALASVFSINAMPTSQTFFLFDRERRKRLKAVAKRGDFNRFIYHASGPFAFARNMVMKIRPAEKFLTDLDWLYSYNATNFSHEMC